MTNPDPVFSTDLAAEDQLSAAQTPRSPYRRVNERTHRYLLHFLWWAVGYVRWEDERWSRRLLGDDDLYFLAQDGDSPRVTIGKFTGWREDLSVPIPQFDFSRGDGRSEALRTQLAYDFDRILDDAVRDLEPWGPTKIVWEVNSRIFSREFPEHHPLSPHGILFHSRERCLDAMERWLREIILVRQPDYLGTRHSMPFSIIRDVEHQIPGVQKHEAIEFAWRHEDVRLWREHDALHIGSRSWLQAEVVRHVPVFDLENKPAGTVQRKVRVGPFYPLLANSDRYHLPDPSTPPDFIEGFPIEPRQVQHHWGD